MTQFESAITEIRPEATDVNYLMKGLEASIKNRVPANVMFNCVLGAQALAAKLDAAAVSKLLMIFLDNACKFTQKGSITLGYENSDDELYFYVKDTGAGMARGFDSWLFTEEDDEMPQSNSRGLVEGQSIIDLMGGEIGAESRGIGKGSTFWFTLPYVKAEMKDVTNRTVTESGEAAAESSKSSLLNILVAEDNESNYFLLESMLEGKYNLIRAMNGQEAVNICRQDPPDMILMDIMMPIMDGKEATRQIRTFNPDIPILAVTAYAFITDRQLIIESGFNDYVSKPISINRLERLISKYLGE